MQDKVKAGTNANLIEGATGDWELIVGLEVHAQVASASKLFSGASTAFGGEANGHVSLVDAFPPGPAGRLRLFGTRAGRALRVRLGRATSRS